jgi:hypothetical protein
MNFVRFILAAQRPFLLASWHVPDIEVDDYINSDLKKRYSD